MSRMKALEGTEEIKVITVRRGLQGKTLKVEKYKNERVVLVYRPADSPVDTRKVNVRSSSSLSSGRSVILGGVRSGSLAS